jgi:hypothetical protein
MRRSPWSGRDWFTLIRQPRSNPLFGRVIQTSDAFAPSAITLQQPVSGPPGERIARPVGCSVASLRGLTMQCEPARRRAEGQSPPACFGSFLRGTLAIFANSASVIDSAMLLAAPFNADAGVSPRFADSAAPAAFCCCFDLAGMIRRLLRSAMHEENA